MGTDEDISIDDLERALNSVKSTLFDLVDSLKNNHYEHPSEQIKDAKAVGELAEKWDDLRRARSAMRDVQADRLPESLSE